MASEEFVEKMFLPDSCPYSLSMAMAARSGSGKTTLITRLIQQARRNSKFKETRFVMISVKGEHLFGEKVKPVSSIGDLVKTMQKNPISVYYPQHPEYYDQEVDAVIDSIFDLSDRFEDASFVIIIDDANILKGFDSRSIPSASIKKLSIAGRSKGVRGVFITHRVGLLPRIMNSNLSGLVIMSMNNNDADYADKIWGLKLHDLVPELGEHRWTYIDLIDESVHKFNPVKPIGGN